MSDDIERFNKILDTIERQYLNYASCLREVNCILGLYLINDIASIVAEYAKPCFIGGLFNVGIYDRCIYNYERWKLTLEYDERPYWNHDRLEIESDDDHHYRIDEVLNELETIFHI